MFLIPKDSWEVRTTYKKGRGIFCKRLIPKKTIIGKYTGNKIKIEEYDLDTDKNGLYLMFLNDKYAIYPDLDKNGVHLINHSCNPNCWILNTKKDVYVFTLRDIKVDEEITISYLLPPIGNCDPCTHKCYCGNMNCKGTMHQSELEYNKWQGFQDEVQRSNS